MLTVAKRKKIVDKSDNIECLLERCRICLKPGDIPIFDNNNILNNIVEFGSISINEDDNLPKNLCEACNLLLRAAVVFRETAQKTDEFICKLKCKEPIDDLDSPEYLQTVNEIQNSKFNLSEYRVDCPSADDTHSESRLSLKTFSDTTDYVYADCLNSVQCDDTKTDSLINDESIDEFKAEVEEEYLVLSESDEEKDYNSDNPESDISKSDAYMVIVSNEAEKDNEETEQFTCDVCSMHFETIGQLENHIELEHNIKNIEKVKCGVCNEVVSKSYYEFHMKTHREKYMCKNVHKKTYPKIECKTCHKKVNKAYYKQHVKMHGSEVERAERTRPCVVCNKHISITYYKDHLKRVHKVGLNAEKVQEDDSKNPNMKYIECPVCDKYIKENYFKGHLAGHGKMPKKYVCEHCSKEFRHPSAFKTHILLHGGPLKYECQFCPYKAQHLGLLKIHVRTHTGDYNYKCTQCSAKFITKSNLNQHLLRHEGPGNIKCKDCDRTFYRLRNMEEHYKTIHLGIRDVICNNCGKGFSHRDRMLSHQLKVHKRAPMLPRLPTYLKMEIENELKEV